MKNKSDRRPAAVNMRRAIACGVILAAASLGNSQADAGYCSMTAYTPKKGTVISGYGSRQGCSSNFLTVSVRQKKRGRPDSVIAVNSGNGLVQAVSNAKTGTVRTRAQASGSTTTESDWKTFK